MSVSALAQALKEYQRLKEPIARADLEEMAKALPRRNCLADEKFCERLTPRQREVFDEIPHDEVEINNKFRERVKEVVEMQVDVRAKIKAVSNNYKEMLGKIKIYELDVMLEDRHTEELRLDSLDVKYTMNDTLAKMAPMTEPPQEP